jgi:hypothetical protein
MHLRTLSDLNNAHIHAQLIEFGDKGTEYSAWLGAYVLMPDHWYASVLVDISRIESIHLDQISEERAVKNASPSWCRVASLAKGFFEHMLRARDWYSAKWHYVRDNPVRAGLRTEWSAWPFIGEIFDLEFP